MHAGLLAATVFACPAIVLAAAAVRPRAAGPAAVVVAALAFVAVLVAWIWRIPGSTIAWVPAWDLSLHFALDGLGALFALLTTGVGALVIVFSLGYLPHDIEDPRERARFFVVIVLFMASMVGLVLSQDLYSLLICWDLTAITSYLLIATHRDDPESRRAARMALVVTAGTAVLLVAAAVVLHARSGTSHLPSILAGGSASLVVPGGWLLACAALAKSAQVPLHFWLPRAMVAPTPVSAYLHSAAMVAAGVFLLARFHPLLEGGFLSWLLLWVGGASVLIGSLLALAKDDIKAILAYSTVAQYGYVVWLLGIGGGEAATAAAFYVGAHGLAKSGLFLTAGGVTEASGGERRLSHLGGLAAPLPVLAAASAVCAAGLAALPLTLGFFKDELFFRVAHQHGTAATAGAIAAAALTLAYTLRFWSGIFLGAAKGVSRPPGALLVGPVVVLAALLAMGGIAPDTYTALAEHAGAVIHGTAAPVEAAYHLDARPTNLMALGAWLLGAMLLALARAGWWHPWSMAARAGDVIGPDRLYELAGRGLGRTSDWLHGIEVRDLRDRAAAVLVPGGALIAAALLVSPGNVVFLPGTIGMRDLPLGAALVVAALSAIAAARLRRHLPTVLALSMVSYSLALAFAFFGAPDVALVAVLVQTVLTMLLLAALSLFPSDALARVSRKEGPERTSRAIYTAIASGAAFAFAWLVLSWAAPPIASYTYVTSAHEAHARDVVTAILADFRALDTLGEASVLAVAVLGITTILRWNRGRAA